MGGDGIGSSEVTLLEHISFSLPCAPWTDGPFCQAYFSGVLKDLGVEDVKVQELFEVTEEAVEQLPYVYVPSALATSSPSDSTCSQPVYGFVFCCRYESEDQEGTEEAPQDLWFANQVRPSSPLSPPRPSHPNKATD